MELLRNQNSFLLRFFQSAFFITIASNSKMNFGGTSRYYQQLLPILEQIGVIKQ
jgi:hypothetical protein